jgi:hypothetical protein
VQATGGYELALDMANGTLVCRNSQGRPLKRVPKAARASATVVIPHPVLLDDLDGLRELALELGLEQDIQQLLREVHHKPTDVEPAERRLTEFAGGCFAELRHALGRAGSLGFQLRGAYAVCMALDGGAGRGALLARRR